LHRDIDKQMVNDEPLVPISRGEDRWAGSSGEKKSLSLSPPKRLESGDNLC
jgi:hypothetical protein